MENIHQLIFEKGLSNITIDDLDFTDEELYQDPRLENIEEQTSIIEEKISSIELKIKNLSQYTSYIKFDHEYYITLDDAIFEQKERKKYLSEDLESLARKKKRIKKQNKKRIDLIKEEIVDIIKKSDSLFYFLEDDLEIILDN